MIIFLNNAVKEVNCLIEEINSLYASIFGSPWVMGAIQREWIIKKIKKIKNH